MAGCLGNLQGTTICCIQCREKGQKPNSARHENMLPNGGLFHCSISHVLLLGQHARTILINVPTVVPLFPEIGVAMWTPSQRDFPCL